MRVFRDFWHQYRQSAYYGFLIRCIHIGFWPSVSPGRAVPFASLPRQKETARGCNFNQAFSSIKESSRPGEFSFTRAVPD